MLPASERYLSERITNVGKIALDANLAFVILSGEYGLIAVDQEILHYDHLLKMNEVDVLTDVVKEQISELGEVARIVNHRFGDKPKKASEVHEDSG